MPQKLTHDQVRHVAKLSRLRLSDEQIDHFAQQLSAVLDYVAKIGELDVSAVEPMAHPMAVANVFRDDEPAAGMNVDEALANAPQRDGPFFQVPKVLGEGSGA